MPFGFQRIEYRLRYGCLQFNLIFEQVGEKRGCPVPAVYQARNQTCLSGAAYVQRPDILLT